MDGSYKNDDVSSTDIDTPALIISERNLQKTIINLYLVTAVKMEATVQAFNKLPRLQSSPSGLSNHWYFSVKHVPFDPPGDMLHIIHPRSHFMTCEGPAQILTLPSPEAQADAIVPLLLKAFVEGVNKGPDGRALPDAPPFVPWTWAAGDRNLADAVEAKLKKISVRADLCTVQSSKKEEDDVANETWKGFLDTIGAMTGRKRSDAERSAAQEPAEPGVAVCGVCKKSGSAVVKRCARCQIAVYCSQECQRSDWKTHKRACKAPGSSGAAGMGMRASDYYNKVAHTVPEARHLAGLVNLTLPTGGTKVSS